MLAFLLTDIDEDLKRAEPRPEGYDLAAYEYHVLVEKHALQFGGDGIQHKGTRVFAVLDSEDALRCALEIARQIKPRPQAFDLSPHLRVAVHVGEVYHVGDEYFGLEIERAYKLLDASRGGHILLSEAAAQHLKPPPGTRFRSLGIHLLKDLGEPQELFALTAVDMAFGELRLPRSLSAFRHNLEPQAAPFFGRARELSEIDALLADPEARLINLLAPGGFGKSRLALQAAADHVEQFVDGVFSVGLGGVRTEERLVFNIAEGLKLAFYGNGDPKQQLVDYLREKEILLVLDNFEQIVGGVALLQEILQSAPKLKLIITSRQRLRIPEERIVEVKGLELPKDILEGGLERYAAIQLFVMAAQRANPKFEPATAELVRAFGICRLLNGMPLGIELAAARVKDHTLSEIHRQIETNQEALASGPSYIPERHRSLKAVFDYSWSLLSDDQQAQLMALSVFRSPFTPEAALHVARTRPAALQYLTDQSLLVERDGKFQFHEIVQYYSKGKLFDHARDRYNAEEAHARYFADFMEDRIGPGSARNQKRSLDEIAGVIEDVQAAWNWALENGASEEIRKISDGLRLFYAIRGFYREGRVAYQKAAEQLSQKGVWPRDLKLYARVLFSAGYFAQKMAMDDEATRYFMQALDAAKLQKRMLAERGYASLGLGLVAEDRGDTKIAYGHLNVALGFFEKSKEYPGQAWAYNTLARLQMSLGDPKASEDLAGKGLAVFTRLNDTRGTAWSQMLLGDVAMRQNRYADAKAHYQRGLAGYVEFGDRGGIAWSFVNLGNISMTMGEYNGAHQLYREAQIIDRELGDRRGLAWTFGLLGKVALASGDYEEAERQFREALGLYRAVGDKQGIEWILNLMGDIAVFRNDPNEAQRCYDEAAATQEDSETHPVRGWRLFRRGVLAQMRGETEEALALLGRSLDFFQKSDDDHGYSAALSQMGKVHFERKEFQEAEKCLKRALFLMVKAHHVHRALDYLMALARILVLKGQRELVYRIMTFAYGHASLWQVDRERYRDFYAWVQDHTPEDVVLKVLEGSDCLNLESLAAEVLDAPGLTLGGGRGRRPEISGRERDRLESAGAAARSRRKGEPVRRGRVRAVPGSAAGASRTPRKTKPSFG